MSIKDPDAIAVITSALQRSHGEEAGIAALARGVTLATLLEAVLSGPMSNRDAVRMVVRSLADFAISPDLGPIWHLRHIYDRPGSFNVVDMAIATPAGMVASAEVTLRLAI